MEVGGGGDVIRHEKIWTWGGNCCKKMEFSFGEGLLKKMKVHTSPRLQEMSTAKWHALLGRIYCQLGQGLLWFGPATITVVRELWKRAPPVGKSYFDVLVLSFVVLRREWWGANFAEGSTVSNARAF